VSGSFSGEVMISRKGYRGAGYGAVSVKKILCCARVFSPSPSPGVSSSASQDFSECSSGFSPSAPLLSPVMTLVLM
jgi:hypothetical protein